MRKIRSTCGLTPRTASVPLRRASVPVTPQHDADPCAVHKCQALQINHKPFHMRIGKQRIERGAHPLGAAVIKFPFNLYGDRFPARIREPLGGTPSFRHTQTPLFRDNCTGNAFPFFACLILPRKIVFYTVFWQPFDKRSRKPFLSEKNAYGIIVLLTNA